MRLLPDSRRGMVWRFLLGALIVVGFTTATTAVAGLLQFKQFATEIGANAAIKSSQVTIANPGNPQTLLLIGSDHRAGTPFSTANTDTMMLVRLDPNSSTINVLSIPRDLKTQIPTRSGVITTKINSAYSIGGPDLLVRIIRQQVLRGININHIIDVNFGGFSALVNAIGCVYADVDHRYYNNTLYTHYSSIDIQPGYQKLCGDDALAFVRFRHTDTDLVRNARQQDFLRWAKTQFSSSTLIAQRDRLLTIFGHHTETDRDLHSIDGLINLFNLVAFAAGHQVKQIPFPAILLPCGGYVGTVHGLTQTPCFVTADPGPEQAALAAFMRPTVPAPSSSPAAPAGTAPPRRPGPPPHPAVISDPADGAAQAHQLINPGIPVAYPTRIAAGSRYCTNATCTIGPVADSYPRGYLIRGRDGRIYPAYRMTLVVNPVLGQYYGVEGTAWQQAPILNSPTETRIVDGKRLLLYFNGHKLSLVAWRTPQAVYWISNTLTDSLQNDQMLAIAASLTPAR